MKIVFNSGVKTYKENDVEYQEKLRIFQLEDEDADEDFDMLSHTEKIYELGLEKENATPDKDHGQITRHSIDCDSMSDFVIVVTTTTIW